MCRLVTLPSMPRCSAAMQVLHDMGSNRGTYAYVVCRLQVLLGMPDTFLEYKCCMTLEVTEKAVHPSGHPVGVSTGFTA